MKEFFDLYNIFLTNPVNISINSKHIYDIAVKCISNTHDINIKEKILTNMLFLYPDDHTLYYMMGAIFKGINVEKELTWYKLSYSKKPDYPDNFFALCNLLLDIGISNHVFELNKNNLFDKFMKEPKFLTVYVRCNLVNLNYKNGLTCLLDLIKLNSTKPCVSDYDRNEKWRNYHDAGYIFSTVCDVENSIKYTQKATELALKFNLSLDKKLLSFQNVLCFSDYIYEDHEKLYKYYLKINNYIPDTPLFSFNNRKKNNKIKIGYVSSDFVMHSVSNFILPILKNHDKDNFEIFLFSNSEHVGDLYKKLNAKIINIVNMSSKDSAKLINSHSIDILFDLNGHTVKNRLEIFTYHPAPIQITYLGYPNTTGLKSIKYRFTDSIADHPNTKQKYSEELIRLPKCFLLYDTIHNFIVKPRKTQSKIILGSINKENKSNAELLNVWKTILEKAPNTIILVKLESFDNKEERTEFYMEKLNITKDRIIVLNKLQNQDYEKLFTMFDILLDPFPYSGTTTTCNSLLNSIPVVTLYHQDYHVTNVSSSLLINTGFPELVAYSKEEYVDIVVNLVRNPGKIDEYKRTIRDKFLNLMQPKPFMKGYESELTNLYNKHYGLKHESVIQDEEDKIEITFSNDNLIEQPKLKKKVYICGCVKNCGRFLREVFTNIDKIISLFDDYKIIIAEDLSTDNSREILDLLKGQYNMDIISVPENTYQDDFTMRSKKISNARNAILNRMNELNDPDFQYFIMMDMDDVCAGGMNTNVLKDYLDKEIQVEDFYRGDWDSLSFNRNRYYDIWALSIDPYVFSCFHFPGPINTVEVIREYITKKINAVNRNELLDCYSAFNGFAIYRRRKFVDCVYDWQIRNVKQIVSKELIEKNEKAFGLKMSLTDMCHPLVNPSTDCEHRYFHMVAIKKNNAKIKISPKCLFTD
jgi:predicted O-linked N-acetylglucosamine transferase (SPINDLY family)